MQTSTKSLFLTLVVVAAVAACADRLAAPHEAPTASRADRREIPAQYQWVGIEHNRFVTVALDAYDHARQADDGARRNVLRRDCGALWELMSNEVHAAARSGGFAGREDSLVSLVRHAQPELDGCARLASGARSTHAGTGRPLAEATAAVEPAFQLIAWLNTQLASAASVSDARRMIADATEAASALRPRDAALAYSMLSLVHGSLDHWAAVQPAHELALALFPLRAAAGGTAQAGWGGLLTTLSADSNGCLTGARVVDTGSGGSSWTSAAAGCLIGGGISSAAAALSLK